MMADFRVPRLNRGERVYRALLRLYPRWFRDAFAQALVEAFRDQRRDAVARGVPAGAFWCTTVADVLTQAAAERLTSAWRTARRGHGTDRQESSMGAIRIAFRFAELRFAARRLARAPTFTVAAVAVLALGIGAATSVFSIVDGVLLRPLPYPASDRLVALGHELDVPGSVRLDQFQSAATFLFYQEHARPFDGVAAWRDIDVNIGAAGDAEPPERLASVAVSANLFDVLRVRPAIGRGFRTDEDRVGAAPVLVLSYALWQRRFQGDSSVTGRHIVVDGVAREIVGVMSQDFAYPSPNAQLWTPFPFDPARAPPFAFDYRGIGRLRDGVTIAAARTELSRILPRVPDAFPGIAPADWANLRVRPVVTSLRDAIVGDVSRVLWILLGSVALLLAIACANVASLFLVRAESRHGELAVRSALGSGLAGIIAPCLSEAVLVASAGGVAGAMLAIAIVELATTIGGSLGVPRLHDVGVDGRVLAFAIAASALSAAFVSLVPILRARRVPVALVLRRGDPGGTSGATRQVTRGAFVVAQVALALVLVAASGLLARSFAQLSAVEPGFDANGVEMAGLALPSRSYQSATSIMSLYESLLEQVRALPGVRGAALTTAVPLGRGQRRFATEVEDHPPPPNALPRIHGAAAVDGRYFRTIGIPLLAGRTFGAQDIARPALEVVVSHAFSERYWPGASPLGKRIRPTQSREWFTIVGEVGDAHYDALDAPVSDIVYFPLATPGGGQTIVPRDVVLLVRRDPALASTASAVREIVHALDPALPTYDERALAAVVAAASAGARVTTLLLAAASAIALLLGAVGIYGVMAYGVTLRRREIGVRLALGAQPAAVSRTVARQGVVLGAIGVAIGFICALGATRVLRGLLYEVNPTDPLTLGATCAVLLMVAFVASWIPARRAANIDPSEALRA